MCFKQIPARWTFEEILNSWDWNNMFHKTTSVTFFMAGFKHEGNAVRGVC